jgi:hypothetical protein
MTRPVFAIQQHLKPEHPLLLYWKSLNPVNHAMPASTKFEIDGEFVLFAIWEDDTKSALKVTYIVTFLRPP